MYAFGEPIIKQFFGIKPLAHLKTIHISPLLPSKLTEGKIAEVEIGDNTIGMSFTQKTDTLNFDISQKNGNSKFIFAQPKGKFTKWKLNGKVVTPIVIGETEVIEFQGLKNSLILVKSFL